MATQPQSAVQPLFPGCASDSDSDSEPDDNEDDDASGRKFPKFVLADVQCLLSYMLLTYRCLQQPRWCKIAKPNCVPRILVIVFDSAPPSAAAQLPKFMANFYQAMRLMSPYAYSDRVGPDLFSLPLQSVALGDRQLLLNWLQKRRKKLQTGSTAAAAGEASPAARSDISIGTLVDPPEKHAAFPERDRFPRTQLLLSSVQLLHENYPMPGLRSCGGGGPQSGPDYKTSLPAYQPAGPSSPMFGLDCEMVVTEGPAGEIDESGRILLDQLVKPANPVLNYLTAKSGITREMLDKATVTLAEVQDQLAQLLPPNAILVGHSLNCDLHALRLYHPSCIDTSVVFNLSGHRRHKSSLKSLAQRFLGRDIQSDDAVGHNSAEDALAALNLVQLKLARSLEFGDAASGDWNPSAADADCCCRLSTLKMRPAAASPARPGHGGFHASHSAGATTASLFDWLRMHGVSFRVFDR
uniref:Exonuclease domain-containing protein n=1 Tax=Macrostomum lignano TaxID=282301 RepID=A0A1I8IER4_9PLAT